MHRTKRVPGFALGLFLFGLLALAADVMGAQPLPPPTPVTPILVPSGGTVPVQLTSKKAITNVEQDIPGIVTVRVDAKDPRTALVSGQSPGIARVTFTDADGGRQVFEFTVQTDTEFLKAILRRAVPTANVDPIPSANNAFILTGTVAKAEDVQIVVDTVRSVVGDRVINALRVGGVAQVELCVTVAYVNRTEARSMGFSFFEAGNQHYLASSLFPGALSTANIPSVTGAQPQGLLSGSPNAIFGIIGPNQSFAGFLNALRTQSLAKILAEPKLVTLSGRPAMFISGGEQAVPTLASGSAGGGAVAGVDFKPFGTTVSFLPIVLGDGRIYLEVTPQITALVGTGPSTTPVPGAAGVVAGRTTQRVQTSVVMEDGQTLAIGGMVNRNIIAAVTRVPWLGDLPFISTAFSTIAYTEVEEELLVLVTPRLIDPLACNQLPKYLPGQETRSPDDFELFLERILEAPRGPRKVCQNLHYVPAYKNDPALTLFPCAAGQHGVRGRCDNTGGCPGSACGSLQAPPTCGPTPCGPGPYPFGCGNGGGCAACGTCGMNGQGFEGAIPAGVSYPGEMPQGTVVQPTTLPGQPARAPMTVLPTGRPAGDARLSISAPAAGGGR